MMARASGRRRLSAEITSSPLPSSSRMSTTAKAGDIVSSWVSPSATDSAVVTVKPRLSMARASRCRNDLSSSTIRSVRSPVVEGSGSVFALVAITVMGPLPASGHPRQGSAAVRRRLYITNLCTAAPAGNRRPVNLEICLNPMGCGACALGRHRGRSRNLEVGAVPARMHDCTSLREDPVLEGEGRTGSLQQCLGNEDAEAEAAASLAADIEPPPARARDIGLADPIHDLGREARPVVADGDVHLLATVGHRHVDPLAREIDRI